MPSKEVLMVTNPLHPMFAHSVLNFHERPDGTVALVCGNQMSEVRRYSQDPITHPHEVFAFRPEAFGAMHRTRQRLLDNQSRAQELWLRWSDPAQSRAERAKAREEFMRLVSDQPAD